MKILYVHATLVPPPTDLQTDRFYLLSDKLEGDVLHPVWFSKPEEVEAVFGPGSYPVYTAGRFRYHWFLALRYSGLRQKLATFWFYLTKGREIFKQQRYECIVAYSHMTTGLFGGLLKLLTGAKLIIEIVTSPQLVYLIDRPHPTWKDRVMHAYSNLCLQLSMRLADRAHFLFPDQLSAYPSLRKTKNSVFHEFVPISIIQKYQAEQSEVFILLSGMPWYLKGADLLIEAFNKLAPDFPDVKLKLLGYFAEGQNKLKELVNGSPQIELLKARPHREALQVISQAAVLALPSRCEGMPRVLIEGMAAGIPAVASDVGGIPTMIREGETGFIVPGGNPKLLEERLRVLLTDPQLRKRMGESGYQRAHQQWNETVYVAEFTRMVKATLEHS
jgi:glycosyltransferase involved in cell wall biosynthesis